MKVLQSRSLIVLAIVALAATAFFFYRSSTARTATREAAKFKEMPVERGTFEILVTANGIVKPIDRVEVKSKASGQIVELPVEQGDFVKSGALIARLDQKDERTAVEQARANLDIAEAELKQAKRNYDRRDQLFQKGLVSEEELGAIELALATANGKLVQAKTTLERAEERLREAVVRAPIDGVILQKYVEEGQIIASGVSNVGGGTPIVDIADMNAVHVEAGIDEIDIGKIKEGQKALIMADAFPQMKFKGEIVRISPEARVEQNVTLFDVVIKVENTDGRLKSGMNATAEITIVWKDNVLLVPAIALSAPPERGGGPNVRVALRKQGDDYVQQQVEIGLSNFRQTEVLSGLNEGDVVAVPLTSRLKEENDRMESMLRSSRSFGNSGRSSSSSR